MYKEQQGANGSPCQLLRFWIYLKLNWCHFKWHKTHNRSINLSIKVFHCYHTLSKQRLHLPCQMRQQVSVRWAVRHYHLLTCPLAVSKQSLTSQKQLHLLYTCMYLTQDSVHNITTDINSGKIGQWTHELLYNWYKRLKLINVKYSTLFLKNYDTSIIQSFSDLILWSKCSNLHTAHRINSIYEIVLR